MRANSAFPDKTAPDGAVLSGQTLLFTKTSEKTTTALVASNVELFSSILGYSS